MKNGRGQGRARIVLDIKTHPQQAQVPNWAVALPLLCMYLIPSPLPGCAEAQRSPLHMFHVIPKALLFPE